MSSRSHNKQELSTTNSISSQFTEKYEAASESDEEETSTNAASSSSTLSPNIRLQKNIAGKLSSKFVAKVFMNEKYNSRLDKLYALASSYSGKKDANKLRKTIVKTIFKTSILYKSDLFNENEMKLIDEVRNRFRLLAESIMKLYENNSHTDRSVLIQTLIECQDVTHRIISTHLADKYHGKIDYIFNYISNLQFIEHIFDPSSTTNRSIIKEIIEDIHSTMDTNSF